MYVGLQLNCLSLSIFLYIIIGIPKSILNRIIKGQGNTNKFYEELRSFAMTLQVNRFIFFNLIDNIYHLL